MSSGVNVPEAVMERVHAEIARALMETPDYIQNIVTELLRQPVSREYRDPDNGKPLFETLMRRKIREMADRAVNAALQEKYGHLIETVVKAEIGQQEMLTGSLAHAFARIIKDDWKLSTDVSFKFSTND